MKEQIEQIPEVTTLAEEDIATANTVDNTTGNSYGQFKSKEDLVEAYKSLQAEFTRRSQRLKELEAEASKQAEDLKWDGKVAALMEAYPVAKGLGTELKEYIATHNELAGQENCLQMALLGVLAERAQTKEVAKAAEVTAQTEESGKNIPQNANLYGELPLNGAERRARMYEIMRREGCTEAVPTVITKGGGEIPSSMPGRPTDFQSARGVAEVFLQSKK